MTHPQLTKTFDAEPMGKPRMTQRDKWKPSLAAKRYHRFKDQILEAVLEDQDLRAFLKNCDVFRVDWTAFLPIPRSLSATMKIARAGNLHRQKPDKDNIEKALLDALFHEDSGIAQGTGEKRWDDGKGPRLEVTLTAYSKGGNDGR